MQCTEGGGGEEGPAGDQEILHATWTAARKMASAPQPKEAEEVTRGRRGGIRQAGGAVRRLRAVPRRAGIARPQADHRSGRGADRSAIPQGEYSAKVREPLFVAYRQAGDNDKAVGAGGEDRRRRPGATKTCCWWWPISTCSRRRSRKRSTRIRRRSCEMMGHEAEAGGHERRRLDRAQEPDHGAGALHERQAVLTTRIISRKADAGTARRAAAGGIATRRVKPEVLYHAGALPISKLDKAAGGGQLFPRLRRHQESRSRRLATTNLARIKTQYTGIK